MGPTELRNGEVIIGQLTVPIFILLRELKTMTWQEESFDHNNDPKRI
jgi:hypothetical protein